MEKNSSDNNSFVQESSTEEITAEPIEKSPEVFDEPAKTGIETELQEQKDKYLRLYAEFENYKKRILKDKEELLKYGTESLLYDLLPVIDNLEMAMKHSSNDLSVGDKPALTGLVQGVEITLREFIKVLDRFGLKPIEAVEKAFDPSLHHAMTQVERDDVEANTVVEEYRKGYMFKDKVLRASLVAVSKKTVNGDSVSKEALTQNTGTDKEIEKVIEEE
ncbi:MAG: nucleotide exchange factor GrpE [Nitrospirae bacterium]|nr:nucleotide exchange factor GrpE [Nitrospirota bacterium]